MPEGTDVAILLSTLGVKSSENKETAGATGVFSSLVRSVVNLTVSGHTFLEVATMSTTWLPQSPQVSTPLMVSVKFTGPHSLHLKDAGSCVKCDNIGVAIEAMAFGRLEKGVARWRFMLRGESGNMVLLLLRVFPSFCCSCWYFLRSRRSYGNLRKIQKPTFLRLAGGGGGLFPGFSNYMYHLCVVEYLLHN